MQSTKKTARRPSAGWRWWSWTAAAPVPAYRAAPSPWASRIVRIWLFSTVVMLMTLDFLRTGG